MFNRPGVVFPFDLLNVFDIKIDIFHCVFGKMKRDILLVTICILRWPTSALRNPNDTPNSLSLLRILKTHPEFLNVTPNSKNMLKTTKFGVKL